MFIEDDSNGHHDGNENGNGDSASTFDKEGGNDVSHDSRNLCHNICSESHPMETNSNNDALTNTQHRETKKQKESSKIKDMKTMTNVKSITAADVINNNNDPEKEKVMSIFT